MNHLDIEIEPENTAKNSLNPEQRNEIGWGAVVWMLLLVASVHLASHFILDAGMPLLLGAGSALGWLVYRHIIEARMFQRRAIAEAGAQKSGFVYRLLYKGSLTRLITFIGCMVLSGCFLLHANQMPLYIWLFIYLDSFIIVGLLRLTRSRIKQEIKPAAFGVFSRGSVFILNFFVLTLLIIITGYFMPTPDLRELGLLDSFNMAWQPIWQQSANPVLAAWAGFIAGMDAMAWNIMQQISQWNIGTVWKITGWGIFFALTQAIYLWLIQSAMLGTLAVAEHAKTWRDYLLGTSRAARWGWGIFYGCIMIWLILSLMFGLQQHNRLPLPLNISGTAAQKKIVIDLCKDVGSQQSANANASMDEQIMSGKSQYLEMIDNTINARIDAAFEPALKGVGAYLDWYFTLSGEWQRLATVVVGDIGQLMQERMQQFIMDDSGFLSAINGAEQGIAKDVADQFTQTTRRIISVARKQVDIRPCATAQHLDVALPSLSRDLKRVALTASTAAAAGAAIAISTGAAITTKLAATASAKLAAKVLAKAAAKAAARTAGGIAGASAGAFAGLSCGPYAPACSSILAIAGFFGIDALFIEGDELINRDQMRSEIINELIAERDQLKAQQKASYHKAGNQFFTRVSEKTHEMFTPVRDGV